MSDVPPDRTSCRVSADQLTAHRGAAAENSLDRERAEYGRVFGFSAGEYVLAAEDDGGAQVGSPGKHILHGLQALNDGSDRRAARREVEDTAKLQVEGDAAGFHDRGPPMKPLITVPPVLMTSVPAATDVSRQRFRDAVVQRMAAAGPA